MVVPVIYFKSCHILKVHKGMLHCCRVNVHLPTLRQSINRGLDSICNARLLGRTNNKWGPRKSNQTSSLYFLKGKGVVLTSRTCDLAINVIQRCFVAENSIHGNRHLPIHSVVDSCSIYPLDVSLRNSTLG